MQGMDADVLIDGNFNRREISTLCRDRDTDWVTNDTGIVPLDRQDDTPGCNPTIGHTLFRTHVL